MLPSLLQRLGRVEVFLHDSLHTFRNIMWELVTVAPWLAEKYVVIADDVQGNSAFAEWASQRPGASWDVIEEEGKKNLFGVCLGCGACLGTLRRE